MHKRRKLRYIAVILILALSFVYYSISFGSTIDTVFLTISTFVFSIFAGFFISRQAARQHNVRNEVAKMNGNVSFVYRGFGHFGDARQEAVGKLIAEYYERVIRGKNWNLLLSKHSTFFTGLHDHLETVFEDDTVAKPKAAMLTRISAVLASLQENRKILIALLRETIPVSQWILVYILMTILIVTISTLPSQGMVLESLLKAGFVTAVIFVVIILSRFDRLLFFEDVVGESSAQDVVDIIGGAK